MTELDVNGTATDERSLRTPGWARASDDEIAERDALAASVVAVLRAAGCPADLAHPDTDRDRGYYVEVDAAADFAGGVFVMWAPGGTVGRQAKDAVLRLDYTHPAIKFHGEVAHAMTTATSTSCTRPASPPSSLTTTSAPTSSTCAPAAWTRSTGTCSNRATPRVDGASAVHCSSGQVTQCRASSIDSQSAPDAPTGPVRWRSLSRGPAMEHAHRPPSRAPRVG